MVIGELDAVLLVPSNRLAFPGLLAKIGAQERASLVDRHPADPGPWIVQVADPIPVPVGDQEGLLGQLLGHQPAPSSPWSSPTTLGYSRR
jgi:hypothetical protein